MYFFGITGLLICPLLSIGGAQLHDSFDARRQATEETDDGAMAAVAHSYIIEYAAADATAVSGIPASACRVLMYPYAREKRVLSISNL